MPLRLVAPKRIHKAGFHPDRGARRHGRDAGVAAALGLESPDRRMRSASPAAMASGIIEYLAEGAWTKRMHPGWAAQAGIAAARSPSGLLGPRTVFEGTHGLFYGFAHTTRRRLGVLLEDFGEQAGSGRASPSSRTLAAR